MKKLLFYALLTTILSLLNHYANIDAFISKSVLYIVNPIEISETKALNLISSLAKNYIELHNVSNENAQLKQTIQKLIIENRILKSKLNNSDNKTQVNLIKCPFVFKDFSNLRYIYIKSNAPQQDILHKTVISEHLNLVGKVEAKINDLYKVKTIFSDNFIADCFIINDNDYYRGIFKGSMNEPKIEFLNTPNNIKINDRVVTSGLIGDLAPHINIGTIEKIYDVRGFYKVATVKTDKTFLNDSFVYVVNVK